MKVKPPHYKADFFIIYQYDGIIILYYSVKNLYDLEYKLKNFINQNIELNYTLYLIYSFEHEIQYDFIKDKQLFLIHSKTNYELFFHLHLLRHDYFYQNKLNTILYDEQVLLDIYDKINVPLENFKEHKKCHMYSRKDWLINNYKNSLIKRKNNIDIIHYLDVQDKIIPFISENKKIETIEYYCDLLEEFDHLLKTNIPNFSVIMDFKEFANLYTFEKTDRIYGNFYSKNILLENVYYINKSWFDHDKKLLKIEDFEKDFEYREFNGHFSNQFKEITNLTVHQEIKEEVMFLDYVYGYYNFGEFWDVVKRLLVSKEKGLPLFHLSSERITNIQHYFHQLQFKYPTRYQTQENNKKLYYFHKINISTMVGMCRGHIDKFFAYHFNKILNLEKKTEKNYHLYLARGSFGRSIQNENEIVDLLKEKYHFIVLNGSETLEETMHYFTNAKIILGAHGSLMKNMIWCKKNPVFIELSPYTRHDCFGANSLNCGFTTFFFVTDCDEKEQIILNETQKQGLFELLDKL